MPLFSPSSPVNCTGTPKLLSRRSVAQARVPPGTPVIWISPGSAQPPSTRPYVRQPWICSTAGLHHSTLHRFSNPPWFFWVVAHVSPFHFSLTNGIMNAMKNEMIQIDKAGRVVLPKPLREQFNLLPGDKLRLSVEGNGFRLEPTDAGGELVRKGSVLVFTGGFPEPITTAQVNELIEQDREGRIMAATGKLRRK